MKCPVCENTLSEKHLELPTSNNWDDMRIDVCRGGCGGIWFDRFELDKVDEPDEVGPELLFDIEHDESLDIDHDADRNCPKCGDVVMMKRFFTVSRNVEIDKCGGCAGVWLDAGELETLRGLYDSEEEREEAFEKHFEEEFAPKLEAMESEDKSDEGVRAVLRFISPSYWIPGDQTGAAW